MLATAVKGDSQKSECSFTISGFKYDVSKWLAYHPGGDDILRKYNGLDATDVFNAFHSEEAHKKLANLKGEPIASEEKSLKTPQSDNTMYKELERRINAAGLLDRSPYFYIYKTTTTVGLCVLAIVLLVLGHWIPSAIAMGIFWQQAGWLSHEYCHHCVFRDRKYNKKFGLFLANLLQGYSISWWKDRHNTHHAITNVLEADPDIDNLPLFMWTPHDFHRLAGWSEKGRQILGATLAYQAFYFIPFCATLRLIWCLQSVIFSLSMRQSPNQAYRTDATTEILLLAAHWTGLAALFFFYLPSVTAMTYYFFISELIGGFCLAIIVFFNHYACEQFPNAEKTQMNFVELQLRTTRNATPGVLMDWFAGGLNYQVEHHLFPTMPRNNLYKATFVVRQFCKEHSLPYQTMDFSDGLVLLLKHLNTIGGAVPRYLEKLKKQ